MYIQSIEEAKLIGTLFIKKYQTQTGAFNIGI